MPFIDTIHYPDGSALHLWQQSEGIDEMLDMFRRLDVPLPSGLDCCEKRVGEKLVEALLLHRIFGGGVTLGHSAEGAPVVNVEGVHISISHTCGWVGVARNDHHRIGFDIEQCCDRVLRVRERFLNKTELQEIPACDVQENTLAWTAKEAIYKLYGGERGPSLCNDYAVGKCVQVINRGYILRPAMAAPQRTFDLTVISQVMSGAVMSLAVETRYLV